MAKVIRESAPREGNDFMAEGLTYLANLLGWVAVVWGVQRMVSPVRPFGYILGVAALLASIVPAYTNRMRDARATTGIGVIAVLASAVIVVVILGRWRSDGPSDW